jgi:hypothetical protein
MRKVIFLAGSVIILISISAFTICRHGKHLIASEQKAYERAISRTVASSHPRLILTPDRINALRSSIATTHKDLWQLELQSADEFCKMQIPKMKDAHNDYRTYGDMLPSVGLAYKLTGNMRYVEVADKWLQAFLAVPEWKGSANLGRSAWVTGCAITYDWLYDALPAKTRTQVAERLVKEAEILLKESSHRLLSNHFLIETSALGMVGLALQGENPRANEFLEKSKEWANLIIKHAPTDGSWGEGIQYWQYGLGYFVRYLEASKTAGFENYYARYDWLKKTGFFPIYFSLPSDPQKTVNFSDSGDGNYVHAFFMYLFASVYKNGYFQDFGNKTRSKEPYRFSWLDVLNYDPSIKPIDYTTLPTFKHFDDNGFVTMRSSWATDAPLVGFHCGAAPGQRNQADPQRLQLKGFGPGHGHPDINSFSIFAYGKWLALDAGYVYEKWTKDHNTVLVNGKGQAGEGGEWLDYMAFENREPAPSILVAKSTSKYDYVIGDAGNVYVEEAGLSHFRRHLLFLKPNIVVILDDLKGKQPSKFEWLLQAYDKLKQTGTNEFEINQDGVRLSIQPLLPQGYKSNISSHQLKGSASNGKITTLDLAIDSKAETKYLVVLSALPDAKTPAPKVEFKNGRLKISQQGKSWNVEVKEPKESNPAEPLLVVK